MVISYGNQLASIHTHTHELQCDDWITPWIMYIIKLTTMDNIRQQSHVRDSVTTHSLCSREGRSSYDWV